MNAPPDRLIRDVRRRWVVASALTAGLPRGFAAQPARTARLGVLGAFAHNANPQAWAAFLNEMAARGWHEERNLIIHSRHTQGQPERLNSTIAELVELAPDVMLVNHSGVVAAIQAALPATPIVVVNISHAVEAGYAQSLQRPGGQITGVVNQAGDLAGKTLELLREMRPGLSRLGVLWSPSNPGSALGHKAHAELVKKLGLRLYSWPIEDPAEVDAALVAARRDGIEAINVHPTTAVAPRVRQVLNWSLEAKVATVGQASWVRNGYLMSYWARTTDLYRTAAGFVDRVLRGAKPADLPIAQPTTFDLVVNVRTARAIGLTVPQSIRLRADELIE